MGKRSSKEGASLRRRKIFCCPSLLHPNTICDDDDEYSIQTQEYSKNFSKEPDNSLNMGDEHLDTIPATESDEEIKSRVENLVPIPSEFEGISDDSCDMPICDIGRINVESGLLESLINRYTSSDDDDFEDIEYVSLEEVNEVYQEEKEFDLEDILQIQDVILREKLLNVSRLISNIESLKDNPIPIMESDSSETSLSFSDNSLPEFKSLAKSYVNETVEWQITTAHAISYSSRVCSVYFDNPSLPRPPPEPPDIEILKPEINNLDVLYNDESFEPRGDENVVVPNVEEDNSFTFVIRTFLPFITYPEVSPLSSFTGSEDTIFDLDIFA
ncbi:hypothetical protein Tco_1255828 [Tanacetum coccineum]